MLPLPPPLPLVSPTHSTVGLGWPLFFLSLNSFVSLSSRVLYYYILFFSLARVVYSPFPRFFSLSRRLVSSLLSGYFVPLHSCSPVSVSCSTQYCLQQYNVHLSMFR